MAQILLIEDEPVIRSALRRLLERHGYEVSEAGSVEEAVNEYHLPGFSLIISDLRLPGAPGTDIIDKTGGTPVLIMTSYASVRSAVDSMKQGAIDYISKPFDHDELLTLIKRILKQAQLEKQTNVVKNDLRKNYQVKGMVGNCPAMQEVALKIAKVAPTNAAVLVLGESGTGKELVAKALHEQSERCDAPVITVNCAAIPEQLIESELFGHEKGAFTGAERSRTGLVEAANGGTLFLDEIGELPLAAQARLLRVLQNGEIRRVGSEHSHEVDIRLVSATHRDLKQLVQDSKFRSDLYFRLRVVELNLPPLRERGQDIVELAEFLLKKVCGQLNRPPVGFSKETLRVISSYAWPGNVRELENALERAVILCDESSITPELLAIEAAVEKSPDRQKMESDLSLEDYFIHFVRENEGSMTETELAKRLGISRKTLWERRNRFGIPRNRKHN
ncbi:MAG: sigma-54-dependent Fis family transcriptional regulator [Gammaproteobacteria bacterium]|nr:sigma-54-dependent Fis family transcriptional regulator [Gammaproteobacteria bacterium]